MPIHPRVRLLLTCLVLPFAACSKDAAAHTDPLKAPLGLEGATLVTSPDNPVTAAKAELGKQLFFDPRLSNSGTMACAACHLPEKAFTDGRAVAPKDNGKDNTRNAPTMYNVGYLDRLYWDGRTKNLHENVKAAWTGQLAAKPEEVAKKLAGVPEYEKAFQAAFQTGPSEQTIVFALASFLRTLQSGNSAYDRYKAGKTDALGDAAKRGEALFTGKAGCAVCHTPPLFTDKIYHNVGIGMTAENPDLGAGAKNAFDDPAKTGAFKTPTLRDVAKTGPWFHDGKIATLAEAVKLMASGGLDNPHKDPLLVDRKLSDAELADLVAFLESLSGDVAWTAPVLPK